MVIICPSVIATFVVVIGLTYVLRHEIYIICQLYVHSCIPAGLLEPRKAVVYCIAELAPIWFEGKMSCDWRLRYLIVNLSSGTKNC